MSYLLQVRKPRKMDVLLRTLLLASLCACTLTQVLTAGKKIGNIGNKLSNVNIECNSNSISVRIKTSEDFNGMIYPKGLSENSSCLTEYEHAGSHIQYELPLRSCNTMSQDVAEGVEYYNTVVVQPHHTLVTSHGKGFHIRCRYESVKKVVDQNVDINSIGLLPVVEPEPLPECNMKIFIGSPEKHVVAEHVKIGDYLTLTVNIEEQDTYGMKVTNCLVKDGLNWSEQPLLNNEGCPIDEELMGPFEYSSNLTKATVTYPAHKFPFTTSVYYQCHVKLCLKKADGCDDSPPICDKSGHNVQRRRRRRETENGKVKESGSNSELLQEKKKDHSVEVFTGLYVNEVDDVDDTEGLALVEKRSDDDFCLSTRKFAIGIAIAGVLLMLAVIMLVACIVHRRRRKANSTSGSSIYSGPYSNHAYSRD